MKTLIKVLDDLVAHQSTEGNNAAKSACIEFMGVELKKHGLKPRYYERNGLPSIVATTQDTTTPKLLLQAHVDVVPGNKQLFNLTEREDQLIGRGVYDMKFAAACYLELARELSHELHNYDFGIMLTTDEEIGGDNGVGMLIEEGYRAQVCVLPDGGDNWMIQSVCNGVWAIELTARGKTAHGSKPWEGENAIDKLVAALEDIRQLFKFKEPEKCTLTVSQMSGGKAFNQVPDHAEATLDMRFVDAACYNEKRSKVEHIAHKYDLQLKTVAQVDPNITDLSHPEVSYFIETAERITGKEIKSTRSTGSSDARYFDAVNIPVILIRPDGGGAHSENEWIDRQSLFQFYDVIKSYVIDTTRIT